MKRTLQPKPRQLETNIDLIRKIAWSFHNSTGEDWDDLFQEASLAYCEALENYNPDKGKITTYMWWCISSHLVNYLRKDYHQASHLSYIEDIMEFDSPIESTPFMEALGEDAAEIVNMVLDYSTMFDGLSPQLAQSNITRILFQRKDWMLSRIKSAMRELKLVFS